MRRSKLTAILALLMIGLAQAAFATDYQNVTFAHTNTEGVTATTRTDSNGQTCTFVTNGNAQGMACWTGAGHAPNGTAWSDSNNTYLTLAPHVGDGWGCVIAYTKYIDMVDKVCTDGCANCGCMICLNNSLNSSQSLSFGPGPF